MKSSDLPASLSVAVSPCPNDTFIFGAWILGGIADLPDTCSRFTWKDVENLNTDARAGVFDVVKVSAAAALDLQDSYTILRSGGAFGLQDGPKLVVRSGFAGPPRTVAVPGLQTTAMRILGAALPETFTPVPMQFDTIVPALLSGEVDAGLLIHETALIYGEYGLDLLLDLGKWWRTKTSGKPLPLGCILARNTLGAARIAGVEQQIRTSLETARIDPAPVRPLLRSLAQELDDTTLDRHIAAYVNEYSLDFGPEGEEALRLLNRIHRLR